MTSYLDNNNQTDKHPGGRPQEHDRIKIGQDFIKYAKENPSCISVPHFTSTIGMSSVILRNWCKTDPEFRSLYMLAKEIIGINRFNCTQDSSTLFIETSLYKGTLHHYDYDIREDIREEKEFEAFLEKEQSTHDQQADLRHQESMQYLKDIRDNQALNKADNSMSKA